MSGRGRGRTSTRWFLSALFAGCLGLLGTPPSSAAALKSVQSGTAVILDGSTNAPVSIASVDLNKAFLVFSVRHNDPSPAGGHVTGQITSPTSVIFQRVGTNSDATVEWSVVEFTSGVTVQRGSEPLSAAMTRNVSLASTDLSRSFPIISQRVGGTVVSNDDFVRARLTSPTNLELSAYDPRADSVVEWQVVEYTGAAVQTGDVSFASGDSSKPVAGLSSFATDKAWLVYSYKSDTGTQSNIGQKLVRGVVTGTTSLLFDRGQTGQPIDLTWYLVEFEDDTGVQHANVGFTGAEQQKDVSVAAVDPTRSIATGGYMGRGGKSPYSSNDHTGVAWFATELTSGTNLRIRRDFTGSSTADLGWFVIQFSPAWTVTGTVYHDADDSGTIDAGELGIGDAWVKLVQAGSVVQTVPVDPDTGAYTLLNVADNNYDVIVDDNNNGADSTPTAPVNWTFGTPAAGLVSIVVAGADVTDQDFGLTFNFDLAADCACDYEDGVFEQVPIGIDGNMADWATVFADGDNNACDATDGTDLDYPVQSTGRNLLRTAVTWDGTYFAMWTQRVGQSSNTQNFVYYADTNADGILQDGDPVVVAKWQGNIGVVTLELYEYNEVGIGGDPMLDTNGFADGYSMPGDLTLIKTLTMPDGAGQGSTTGSTDGTQMEWKIEWTELGVDPGDAIGWHVGSTNANPGAAGLGAQIDDNLGGCGGQCTGTNQFAGILPTPLGGTGGSTVYSAHQFTNTGNGVDLFDITWTSTGDFVPASVTFYRDLGTVGEFDPADVLLTDTDGDPDPDTGNLAPGASFDLLIAIELPGPGVTGSAVVTTTAMSNFVPGCGGTAIPVSGSVDDPVRLPPLIVKLAVQSDGTPLPNGSKPPTGVPVKYMLYFANYGVALTDVSMEDVLDAAYLYKTDSMKVDDTLLASVVCPAGVCDEAAIFAQVNGSGISLGDGDAVTAPIDADAGSYDSGTTTISLGDENNGDNAQQDVPADRILALVFTAILQ